MKHFYLKIFLLCLFAWAGTKAMAYDCCVNGIYYSLFKARKEAYVVKDKTYSSSSLYTGIFIPSGITYDGITYKVIGIDSGAFSGCSNLSSVNISSGVMYIGDFAFSGCSGLKSITIPETVNSINGTAFAHCPNLSTIKVANGNKEYDSRDNCNAIIKTSTNELVVGLRNTFIPNSVTSIGEKAFYGCDNLKSITIPRNITHVSYDAFRDCTDLNYISVADGNTVYDSRDNCNAIIKTSENELFIGFSVSSIPNSVTKIGDNSFQNCENLTSVNIPNSVTSIGDYAFAGCTGLVSIIIPNGVDSIGGYSFNDCANLTSVTIPPSMKKMGIEAFAYCNSLSSVYITDILSWCNINFQNSFKNVYGQYQSSYGNSNPLHIAHHLFLNGEEIKDLIIPNEVTRIGNLAFRDCELNSITIGDNLESFGDKTFPDVDIYVNNGTRSLLSLWNRGFEPIDKVSQERLFKPYISIDSVTASSIFATMLYVTSDKYKISPRFHSSEYSWGVGNPKQVNSAEGLLSVSFLGLMPNYDYSLDGSIIYKIYDYEGYISPSVKVKTNELKLITSQPKVISLGNVIVSAQTNLDEEETNVGFEWRRTDWEDDFASNTGTATLYEGIMEGYIRNLNTEKLWKYRPYYLSNSGTYYYGDWVGIDPTNTSYFEPTVHTYAKIEVDGNTALVKGYALRGTDNVTVQGFMYWKDANKAKAAAPRRATEIPKDAMMVKATGQTMTATLKNLDYESTYEYVAFVTTSEGETFYGDVRSFTTSADPTGIENVELTSHETAVEVARYDLSGHRLTSPHRGINIVRMSDGTVSKVLVK